MKQNALAEFHKNHSIVDLFSCFCPVEFTFPSSFQTYAQLLNKTNYPLALTRCTAEEYLFYTNKKEGKDQRKNTPTYTNLHKTKKNQLQTTFLFHFSSNQTQNIRLKEIENNTLNELIFLEKKNTHLNKQNTFTKLHKKNK